MSFNKRKFQELIAPLEPLMSIANPLNQLQNLKPIEDRLWETAVGLRANSNLASNEFFLPVMGLIFLRHAFNRFKVVRNVIVSTLPTRGGKSRPLTKQDYHQIDNDLLSGLLRTFNDPELQKAGGDVFGRIYEYFLTKYPSADPMWMGMAG